jgi:hypothetical protein
MYSPIPSAGFDQLLEFYISSTKYYKAISFTILTSTEPS